MVIRCAARVHAQLAVVGSVNVDTVLKLDRLPAEGETIAAHGIQQFPGGKGANQAAAAAKLGCVTTMVGQVGSDGGADFMLSSLKAQGVQMEGTVRTLEQQSTGTAFVMLLPSGENSIIIVGGANTAPWDLSQPQKDAILQAKLVLLQREIPDSVNLQVAQMCKEAGVDVILDAGGAEGPLSAELLVCLSLLSPNETELSRMTEMDIKNSEDVLAACKKLQQQGASDVLVKLGSRGSVLVTSAPTSPPSHMIHDLHCIVLLGHMYLTDMMMCRVPVLFMYATFGIINLGGGTPLEMWQCGCREWRHRGAASGACEACGGHHRCWGLFHCRLCSCYSAWSRGEGSVAVCISCCGIVHTECWCNVKHAECRTGTSRLSSVGLSV